MEPHTAVPKWVDLGYQSMYWCPKIAFISYSCRTLLPGTDQKAASQVLLHPHGYVWCSNRETCLQ